MNKIEVVEVRLWGKRVGAVSEVSQRPGFYQFQYAPEFVSADLSISPIMMPLDQKKRYSFPTLNQDTYHGLPGLLADSLPDKFGNALIDEYMARQSIHRNEISSLQRLIYVGKRAMGALEFEPAIKDTSRPDASMPLQMAHLVEGARQALRGEFSAVAQDIIDVGSSAGGARAKALIGWNPETQEVVSGQFDLEPGYEHWLLKFDGVGDDGTLGHSKGFGRIEYAHYLMAKQAGIQMSECRLMEENGRAHFMTRRFDRKDNKKLHVQSLCGIAHLDFNIPYTHSYEQYLRTILELNIGASAMEQGWRRCVFNVLIRNCDDHTKNLAFLMNPTGQWSLAPAYDVCFSHNPAQGKWTRQHQMLVAGKAQGITKEDLLTLGSKFDINRPAEKFELMRDVVKDWPKFAKEAGVPLEEVKRIAELQELLEKARV